MNSGRLLNFLALDGVGLAIAEDEELAVAEKLYRNSIYESTFSISKHIWNGIFDSKK